MAATKLEALPSFEITDASFPASIFNSLPSFESKSGFNTSIKLSIFEVSSASPSASRTGPGQIYPRSQ